MILARIVTGTDPSELELAFTRMGLPTSAREYLQAKIPQAHLLLTGLQKEHARFLRTLAERQDAPGHEAYPAFVSGDATRRPGAALLSGRRDQFERLMREAASDPTHREWAEAVAAALRSSEAPAPLVLGERTLVFGGQPHLMGIVNVTPDSFSDGGRFEGVEQAVAHGEALAKAGAAILDVGGESTRPGSAPVPIEEELRRTIPVIRALCERLPEVPVSIDTRKAEVARAALEAGAVMVNDVSGLTFDPNLARVAADGGAALCLMHAQGMPQTMQQEPKYDDAVAEITEFLAGSVAAAEKAGVGRERLVIDPGIGFGKTFAHNHLLLRRLRDFRLLGLPVLVGPSRKAFLGALAGGRPPGERVVATAACAAAIAVNGGADLLRVHDVAEVAQALAVADAVRTARDGGALF